MLDVRRMRVLREVAACGSFSSAAAALNFTQSAISQHVAALEREAGTQLVERGRRGVRLTDAGRVLVAHADAILARIDSAEEELAALAGLRGGGLRVVSVPRGDAGAGARPGAGASAGRPVRGDPARGSPLGQAPARGAGAALRGAVGRV